jgi:O-antigen biosynthesis protein
LTEKSTTKKSTEQNKSPHGKHNNYPLESYDKFYYDNYCGGSYTKENLFPFFTNIAQKIIEEIQPKKVLDAGCAKGFLVEALRDKGVEAYGIDISTHAINEVRNDLKQYCKVRSVTEPLAEKYDLIICMEVLEHLKPYEAEKAIENFCNSAEDILFSSTPDVFTEATHYNVKPPEYWASLFAKYSFFHDVDFDGSFISGQTIRFRKNKEPVQRLIQSFERKLWEQKKEILSLRDELIKREKNSRTIEGIVREETKKIEEQFRYDPISFLLFTYNSRIDLQKTYPEVKQGNYKRLFKWGYEAASGIVVDPNRSELEPYLQLYKQEFESRGNIEQINQKTNEYERHISELRSEEIKLNNNLQQLSNDFAKQSESYTTLKKINDSLLEELKTKDTVLSNLAQTVKEKDIIMTELQNQFKNLKENHDNLTKLIHNKENRIIDLQSKNNEISSELSQSKSTLSEIRNSYGYNLLVSCQQKLDRIFPDNTSRGELKKIFLASLRIISKEGYASYLRGIRKKISRREFKVLPSPPIPNDTPVNVITTKNEQMLGANILKQSDSALKFGVNFSAYFKGEFGVAESSRSITKALQYAGIPHVLNNLTATAHRNEDATLTNFSDEYPYKINLVNVNAAEIPHFYSNHGPGFFHDRYNIAVWFWEMSTFPQEWIENSKYFDEIWVYTNFVANSIRNIVSKPVIKITPTIFLDENKLVNDKKKFGLRDDYFTFLYIFDFHSVLERKNPYAAISAFEKAFRKNDNAVLVLKYVNAKHYPNEEQELLRKCEGINVKIINNHMDKTDLQSLMMSSDCYISLHRSEGFGYTIADAMYLGKPVIVTPYGGNTDFTNTTNSFLVKYKLIELDRDFGPYKKGNVWADPDIEDAAYLMRYVYENREFAKEMGERGSQFIRSYFNSKVTGNDILLRLKNFQEQATAQSLITKEKEDQIKHLNELINNLSGVIRVKESIIQELNSLSSLEYKPEISIIVPIKNPDISVAKRLIQTFKDQYYQNWELCICNVEKDKMINDFFTNESLKDERVRVIFPSTYDGQVSEINAVVSGARGEFVFLFNPEDELANNALSEVVKFLNKNPDSDFIYSDEDIINNNVHTQQFYKPDWSPDLILSYNYTNHLSVFRTSLLKKIGGFREGFDGCENYDLTLRFTEQTQRIGHIPKILYSCRKNSGLPPHNLFGDKFIYENGKKALQDVIRRRKLDAVCEDGIQPGTYRIRYHIRKKPLVTIIIPTKTLEYLTVSVQSIVEKSTYRNFEIIVLDTSNTNKIENFCKKFKEIKYERIHQDEFNFSKLNNRGAQISNGKYLICLNDDTQVITSNWIEGLLEHAQREDIAIVGAKLLYKNDHVQHAGTVIGINGNAGNYGGMFKDEAGYFSFVKSIRNCSSVTAACMMIRKEFFVELKGFDEEMARSWQDVDICLRAISLGKFVVYTPYCVLYHYEGASRGGTDTSPQEHKARELFMKKHSKIIREGDPFYNPNLSLMTPFVYK